MIVTGALVGAGGLVLAVLALWCCQQHRHKQQHTLRQSETDILTKAGADARNGAGARDAETGDARSRKDKGDGDAGMHGRYGRIGNVV